MAREFDFHYTPLEGKLPGLKFQKQTEDAINDIGQRVVDIQDDAETAIETAETAMETAQEAKDIADGLETAIENAQQSADNANASIVTINNTLTEISWTQDFTDIDGVLYQKVSGEDVEEGEDTEELKQVANRYGQSMIANAINSLNTRLLAERLVSCTNVAQMIATDIPAGAYVETKGYYAVNDGGNARYSIRASISGETYDNGSLILLDNGNVAELITDGVVNVKQFGAYGDGTHDDKTALQNAIKSNRIINLQGGTYRITSALNFNYLHDIEIYNGKIIHDVGTTHNTIRGGSAYNINVHDIKFDAQGNDSDITYTWIDNIQACCILASSCSNIRFDNNIVKNYNYGVCTLGADENDDIEYGSCFSSISGNIFDNCKSMVDTYGKDIVIDHNYFLNCAENAIAIEPPYSEGDIADPYDPINAANYKYSAMQVTVAENYFKNVAGRCVIAYKNSISCQVINNTFTDFYIAVAVDPAHESVVDGNTFIAQKPQTHVSGQRPTAHKASVNVKNTIVSNNHFINVVVGIYERGGSKISNNLFDKVDICAIDEYISDGFDADNFTVISNNKVLNMNTDATLWAGCRPFCFEKGQAVVVDNVILTQRAPFTFISPNVGVKLINNISLTAGADTPPALSTTIYVHSN